MSPVEQADGSREKRSRTGVATAAVVLTYCALAVFAYWHSWSVRVPHIVDPQGNDPIQNIWFLAWTQNALIHHRSLTLSTWADYPLGLNLYTNTSMELLGIVVAPVTLVLGPVVALNVLLATGMASAATAMYFLARRYSRWWPAAFVAGLVYGFSPYMVAQGTIHVPLSFIPLPPLMFLVLDEIVVRQRRRPIPQGILLGVLAVAQFFINSEILATCFIMSVVGVLLLAAFHPHRVRARWRPVLTSVSFTVLVAAPALAYPAWVMLWGPRRIVGANQVIPQAYRSDLAAAVVPSRLQAISPPSFHHISALFNSGLVAENGGYLGVALIAVLAVAVIVCRRKPVIPFAAAMLALAYTASLGSALTVAGKPDARGTHGFPLPEGLLRHLPVFSSIIPSRFALYADLFVALILCVFLDHIRFSRRWHSATRACVALGVAAVALVLLVPAWPYPASAVSVPSFFTTNEVDAIPSGSVAITFPYPGWGVDDAEPMLWQAMSNFRFRMPGGYFDVPQSGTGTIEVGIPTVTFTVFNALYEGKPVAPSSSLRYALWSEWAKWHVKTLIADPVGKSTAQSISFLTWLVGSPPRYIGGVDVWSL